MPRVNPTCPRCLIDHASTEEAAEMHAATENIRLYLRERMQLIINPVPIVVRKPNALSGMAQAEGK